MPYSLRELNGRFTKYKREAVDPTVWLDGMLHTDGWRVTYERAEFQDADGIWFSCPQCHQSGYRHSVRIGFEGRAEPGSYGYNNAGQPVLWNMSGTSLDDLVLTPSIQIQGGCNWHGFVGSSGIPPGWAG